MEWIKLNGFFWIAHWQRKGNPLLQDIAVMGHERLRRSYCHPEEKSHKPSYFIGVFKHRKVHLNRLFHLFHIKEWKNREIIQMYPEVSLLFYMQVFKKQSSEQHWRSTRKNTSAGEEAPGNNLDLFFFLWFEIFDEELLEISVIGSKLWTSPQTGREVSQASGARQAQWDRSHWGDTVRHCLGSVKSGDRTVGCSEVICHNSW